MSGQLGLDLGSLMLDTGTGSQSQGDRFLAGLVQLAEAATDRLRELQRSGETGPGAVLGRLRGTGRGVSFSRLVEELERTHPLSLTYPFEGSDRVGGAVWIAKDLVGGASTTSVAKLRWDSRALDLPMHVHDHSDRFIVVVKGRGYFHVTDESAEQFTGKSVRSIPARERDVFLFTRGTVHTFSTDAEPMTLLSCQLPFLSFDDPKQYRLPRVRWTAKDCRDGYQPCIACDAGWSVLAECPRASMNVLADVLTLGP
jgi:mannose-6-phosphate isomerase-like protein (cupin superfamily)